jgi:hypothetical protein
VTRTLARCKTVLVSRGHSLMQSGTFLMPYEFKQDLTALPFRP